MTPRSAPNTLVTDRSSAWLDDDLVVLAQRLQLAVQNLSLPGHLPVALEIERRLLEAGGSRWMALGNADEQKQAKPDTVEAWARNEGNPVGGWYGLRKGYRGRFGNYVPPVLEALGLAEVEHNPRNNRTRAI